jgi:hypothetical protein
MIALAAMPPVREAHAQSSVTLYGVADMNVEYANHERRADGWQRVQSGAVARRGSHGTRRLCRIALGIRGTEALGGGTSALFVLRAAQPRYGHDAAERPSVRAAGFRWLGVAIWPGDVGPAVHLDVEALANFVPMAYATQYEPVAFMAGPISVRTTR